VSKFIKYLDANNLYGWTMCLLLPVGKFKWMDEKKLTTWRSMPCILDVVSRVELEQKELHDLHNDYPLAPGKFSYQQVPKANSPNLQNKTK
jgi:hypothetical protein